MDQFVIGSSQLHEGLEYLWREEMLGREGWDLMYDGRRAEVSNMSFSQPFPLHQLPFLILNKTGVDRRIRESTA